MEGVDDDPATIAANQPAEPPAPRRRLKIILYVANLLVLLILLLLFLVYAVQADLKPISSWVADTSVERFCRQVGPALWMQQKRLRITVSDSLLLPEEKEKVRAILNRMETIRPTHAVVTADGRRLYGRLREEDGAYSITVRNQDGQTTGIPLLESEIVYRQAIVFPGGTLTATDLRFLITYQDYNAYFLPPYLVVSKAGFDQVHPLYLTLSQLSEEARATFGPLINQQVEKHTIRVVHFPDQQSFVAKTASQDAIHLVNSLGFFSIADNTLYLYSDASQLIAQNAKSASLRTVLRHEGTHQLAIFHDLLPAKNGRRLWLDEGLAQYMQTTPRGAPDHERLALLRRASASGKLIDWQVLMAINKENAEALPSDQLQIAYAQSWLLFRHLMGTYRPQFLKYLLDLRTHGTPTANTDTTVGLMNNLGTTTSALTEQLRQTLVVEAFNTTPELPHTPTEVD